MTCTQYPDGHRYHPGRKQYEASDGSRYHPTVRESWTNVLICLCGAECPPDEVAAVKAALAETERERERQRALSLLLNGGGASTKPWPTDKVKENMAPWPKRSRPAPH